MKYSVTCLAADNQVVTDRVLGRDSLIIYDALDSALAIYSATCGSSYTGTWYYADRRYCPESRGKCPINDPIGQFDSRTRQASKDQFATCAYGRRSAVNHGMSSPRFYPTW